MVGRLRNCRFTGSAFPGDVIRHRVRIDRLVDDNAFMSGESLVGDRVVLTVGSLIAVARPVSVVAGGGAAASITAVPPVPRRPGNPRQ
jgi:3-hydroxyacyl-[acyl-carrier-protein] dehydratase